MGVSGLDPARGQSFWSYVCYKDGNIKKGIATLHLLWDGAQDQKVAHALWGRNNDSNYSILRTGTHLRSTPELLSLCYNLKNTPEFQNRGQHFDKLLSLLQPQPRQSIIRPIQPLPLKKVARQPIPLTKGKRLPDKKALTQNTKPILAQSTKSYSYHIKKKTKKKTRLSFKIGRSSKSHQKGIKKNSVSKSLKKQEVRPRGKGLYSQRAKKKHTTNLRAAKRSRHKRINKKRSIYK
jgi:hypothetical protein